MATVESTMKTSASKARAGKGKTTTPSEQRLKRAQRASFLMKQMSDPTRLQIILMLSEGERHVGALCADLSQSQPATSHHLALLRHGGIISPRRHGKNNYYALTEMGSELARVAQAIMD
jgi:DNA-binding transcriptional ArsR family regulator